MRHSIRLSHWQTRTAMLRVSLLLLLIMCSPAVMAQERRQLSQEEADVLARGRYDSSEYLGTRITYEFALTRTPEPGEGWVFEGLEEQVAEGVRTLEIGNPVPGSNAIPYRLTHTIENLGEPLVDGERVKTYWEAFNGSETRKFQRTLYYGKCKPPNEHFGLVQPGCHPSARSSDPIYLLLFEMSAEASRISGRKPPPYRYYDRPVKAVESQIKGVDTLFKYPDGGLVTGAPESLIVSYPETEMGSTSVSELREYHGVLFPQSGTKAEPSTAARFNILSVERINENPESWFYEFPSGTTVQNRVSGGMVRNPYTASEVREIKRVTAPFCPGYTSPSAWPKALFLVLNVAAIAAIIIFFYKRSTRGGRAETG